MWPVACLHLLIVRENKEDKWGYLSFSVTAVRALLTVCTVTVQLTCERQNLLTHNKNSLRFSLSSKQRKHSPLILLLFLCPFFWCRYCFAIMKQIGIREWMLFWVQAFDERRGGEKVGNLQGIDTSVYAEP